MINLASIGPVRILASDDGLLIQAPSSFSLKSRASWPSLALQHPQGLQTALESEQCLELGYALPVESGIFIPNGSFPDVRRSGLAITTRWAEWCPFLLKVEPLSNLGRPDFQYKYLFVMDGLSVSFVRTGYFGLREGVETPYQLDDQTYALVTEMDRFNSLEHAEKTRSESWLVFGRVKECAADVGASLDKYLQSNAVIVPKSVQLNIHEWPDGSISFAPQVAGVSRDALRRAFFHSSKVEDTYSVDGPNHSRLRVVFDERQVEVLERMKGVHRVHGKLKKELLEEPEAIFEGLMDAVEVRYGRRVEGIGALQPGSVPGISREKSPFFDPPLIRPLASEVVDRSKLRMRMANPSKSSSRRHLNATTSSQKQNSPCQRVGPIFASLTSRSA